MTCTNFPSSGLVANVTTHQVGEILYKWTGSVWEAVSPPVDFINNLSLPYVFDTVADMAASAIVFPEGKTFNVGAARYTKINGASTSPTIDPPLQDGNHARLIRNGGTTLVNLGVSNSKTLDSYTALQAALSSESSINMGDIECGTSQTLALTVPKKISGNGSKSKLSTIAGHTGSIISWQPQAGVDPKGWYIEDFQITDAGGSATNVISIDMSSAGEYLSKFRLSGIISNTQTSNNFVELINSIPNIDGLFTGVFQDNWSFGGYFMDNIGDSVYFLRNTTTGAGYGYYINELGTAANVTIRDGNCTVSGNALYCVKGSNITFDNMQVECPTTFTGNDNACISINHGTGGLVFNIKITNNNINTQGNPLRCIYLQETDQTIIDGNNLICQGGVGEHIHIDSLARNTYIGNNKYFDSVGGGEISPVITDNGVGTMGLWKDATLQLAGWTNQNTTNEHPTGYFKTKDGEVQLRGRVAGAATSAGDTIFTLPVGFRPKNKGLLVGTYGTGSSNSVVLQITVTGAVQVLTSGITGVYFSGVTFSTL